jgi:hypothetical protein
MKPMEIDAYKAKYMSNLLKQHAVGWLMSLDKDAQQAVIEHIKQVTGDNDNNILNSPTIRQEEFIFYFYSNQIKDYILYNPMRKLLDNVDTAFAVISMSWEKPTPQAISCINQTWAEIVKTLGRDKTSETRIPDTSIAMMENAKELVETLIGVSKALDRMIYQYNPDSSENEWIGEANEVITKVTGKNLIRY